MNGSPSEIASYLSPSVSFVTKVLTVVGFLLVIFPLANVIAFLVAFIAGFKSLSKWRTAALIGLSLSLLWTIVVFAIMAIYT